MHSSKVVSSRIVVGTLAVEHPELLARMVDRWPGQFLAGLDYRTVAWPGGEATRELAVRGWIESGRVELDEVLRRLEDLSLAGVVVTDIDRDGTGDGPDLAGLAHVLAVTGLPVIASGGVAGSSDLARLAELGVGERRLAGAVVGRALLSGALSIEEAVAACEP